MAALAPQTSASLLSQSDTARAGEGASRKLSSWTERGKPEGNLGHGIFANRLFPPVTNSLFASLCLKKTKAD